jgi:xylulokinase
MGVDIGTTGAKATIFDSEGNILSYAYGEYDIISKCEGHFEINPTKVWETVKSIISKAIRNSHGEDVQAICASSLGEVFVMLNSSGKELANTPIYMDHRGEAECKALICKLGAENIMRVTGHPPHPMYSICKLMWYAKYQPELMADTSRILFFGDYILHKLGGQYVADYSLAARTMCFDITSRKWSPQIIGAAGIDIKLFPETRMTGSVAGIVLPSVADELGLKHNVKLILGGHDQIMAGVGAGIIEIGQAVNSIGTVDCITPLFKGTKLGSDMLRYSYASIPYLIEDTFVTYAFNMTGGSLLKWFRGTFAKTDKRIAQRQGKEIYDLLAEEMPDKPTNLLVLPHFTGSPAPRPDIYGKGAILNLTMGTKRGDIYRACMEGEALEMRHNLETLWQQGIEVRELRTVGGGARSGKWLQMRADIFGKPIARMRFEEAGTLGTAIVAGVSSGCYRSLREATEALCAVDRYYEPDAANHEIYTEMYSKYRQLYDLLKQVR